MLGLYALNGWFIGLQNTKIPMTVAILQNIVNVVASLTLVFGLGMHLSLIHIFKELVNKDLEHHLLNGWNYMNKNEPERNANDTIEDAVFFYPIIGCIRDNLIENL